MLRERDSKLDFESWMNNSGRIFSTQLTGEEKSKFLNHVIGLCSATEIHEFSVGLSDLLYRDFITLLPTELSRLLLSYFDAKTLFTACQVCRNWDSAINGNVLLWRKHCMLWGFRIPEEPCEDASFYKKLFMENSPVHWWKSSWKMVELSGHQKRIMALYYYNGRVATGSDDQTVRIWCCKTGQCLSVFSTHSVAAIKFDDRFLVTASFDRTAASWDVRTGEQLRCYTGHVAAVFCIDFDTPLDILITGSADGTLKLWSISKGELLRTLESPGNSNDVSGPWISNVSVLRLVGWHDHFKVLASNNTSVFCWAIDVKSTAVLTFKVLFDSVEMHDRLVGWEFDGSLLTITSQIVRPKAIKETVYEFCECVGSGIAVRKSGVYPLLENQIEICSYLGSGKYFSAFLCEREEETTICIARRNAEVPPVVINFPSEFRPTTRRVEKVVTLCDRRWLDGISTDIYGQAFLAVIFSSNSVHVLEFGSNTRQT